ncbi:MAG: hypothetical protein PWQ45_113 [Thermosipho sp. (in: thermotogales)]|nr:hypothetical protein [Thermosipho sp. (in: thermotogales)]
METVANIGQNLEIRKVRINELKEQDVNARYMKTETFRRLVENIKDENRLESMPFTAETENGVEIISGHHRIRAAKEAGLEDIYVIVDTSNMPRDKIKSKQISHNSISGKDNEQILRQIFDSIEDASEKIKAYANINFERELEAVSSAEITYDGNERVVNLLFTEYEHNQVERAIEKLGNKDPIYIAEIEKFEEIKNKLDLVSKGYDIKSTSRLLGFLAERVFDEMGIDEDFDAEEFESLAETLRLGLIPKEYKQQIKDTFNKLAKPYKVQERYKALLSLLGIEHENAEEWISLNEIFNTLTIPKESAKVINLALDKMQKKGNVTKKNLWQAVEYWASDYLAESGE